MRLDPEKSSFLRTYFKKYPNLWPLGGKKNKVITVSLAELADKVEINIREKGKWNAIYWEVAKVKGKIDFTGHKKSLLE